MIRVLIVDDHPAMRAGLTAVLRAEPGIVPLAAASASAPEDLDQVVARHRPDVVVLDYHLPGTDGLRVCRRLKAMDRAPAVLLYSAYADASLVIPAVLAGADGLLNKSAPAPELFDALRSLARGDRVLPPIPRELMTSASAVLGTDQLPVLAMVLDGTRTDEVADTLRTTTEDITRRLDDMIDRLRVELPAPA
ncbi:response regulator transcription factor [Baekduia soli]|uniref:Response regulator transcription factor n=1 Tax=Baekduia soli TaxID=496014 RepID=A0A5B8U8Y9_9ACTN|nr:response regulator transcription factor [Baekduia soli]QEC49470.1 response regulator transcription factor [Baekduia soli]